MFLCWRPPYCPRERRRRQRPDRCKKLQEKLRKVQEQERRRCQAVHDRRRAQDLERRKLHEHERRSMQDERHRTQEQERHRSQEGDRSASRDHEGRLQWAKPSSGRSLTPSQSSEEGMVQENYGITEFCVCLPDVWYGIKDFIDLILGAIKATIIEIISFDGSCFSPYLQEILSLTWKYVF